MLSGTQKRFQSYTREIEKFDVNLAGFDFNEKDDLLIITADHGNDPTYYEQTIPGERSSPSWLTSSSAKGGAEIPNRKPFAVEVTIADNFRVKMPEWNYWKLSF